MGVNAKETKICKAFSTLGVGPNVGPHVRCIALGPAANYNAIALRL